MAFGKLDPLLGLQARVQRILGSAASKELSGCLMSGSDLKQARTRLAQALKSVPSAREVRFRYPHNLLAWKITLPKRVLAYVGVPAAHTVDPGSFRPHALGKVRLDKASRRGGQAGEVLLVDRADCSVVSEMVRGWGAETLKRGFMEEPELISHTLEEAVACFGTHAMCNHARVGLNRSPAWDWSSGTIDSRF